MSDEIGAAVLAKFAGELGARIGHGGEATVYELAPDVSGGRILRVYHENPPAQDLDTLAAFYDEITATRLPFALPRIIDHGVLDGVAYSVDRRMHGRPVMDALAEFEGEHRQRALDSYLDGAYALAGIEFKSDDYGELLRNDAIRRPSWRAFLAARIESSLARTPEFVREVPGFETRLRDLEAMVAGLPEYPERSLVHGDYFPGNVMLGDDGSVSGVIDFGPLTVIGDTMMDVASAVIFIEVTRPAHRPEDVAYLTQRLVQRDGSGVLDILRAYRGYYAIRLSNSRGLDDNLYRWCVNALATLL